MIRVCVWRGRVCGFDRRETSDVLFRSRALVFFGIDTRSCLILVCLEFKILSCFEIHGIVVPSSRPGKSFLTSTMPELSAAGKRLAAGFTIWLARQERKRAREKMEESRRRKVNCFRWWLHLKQQGLVRRRHRWKKGVLKTRPRWKDGILKAKAS